MKPAGSLESVGQRMLGLEWGPTAEWEVVEDGLLVLVREGGQWAAYDRSQHAAVDVWRLDATFWFPFFSKKNGSLVCIESLWPKQSLRGENSKVSSGEMAVVG